ncbi:1-deoxy-D-xylulose-5-phosphate synthase N-terminal domain-containing protein [Actinomadura macrotermitis]|uniref:Transketolase 2 n=1 Tax=Actinomadura macrotermitis TaxID=2585200 RepID=A0A7K0BWH1_9ACTN|nr:1-deoxy-D-xylulose-5-phosphate synthase N-terminal domain-containing protein [Actinomadura macrotermitis]MQY05034.1 Transketolase 2 [Actinomadura macrotermitis]
MTMAPVDTGRRLAAEVRGAALEMIAQGGFGFAGSCMSVADILAALHVSWDLPRPDLRGRDIVLLSKGHAAPALYALAYGWDWREHGRYAALGSPLQGHPNRLRWPATPSTTGSLGLGLAHALGVHLARGSGRLALVTGDGELQTGLAWEALMFASRRRTRGVVVIVDANGEQSFGAVLAASRLAAQLAAVADRFVEVDGHDLLVLTRVLRECAPEDLLTVVFARTSRAAGAPELGLGHGRPMSYLPEPAAVGTAVARLRAESLP